MRPDEFCQTSSFWRLGGKSGLQGYSKVLLLLSVRFRAAANKRLDANARSCPGGLKLAVLAYLSMRNP